MDVSNYCLDEFWGMVFPFMNGRDLYKMTGVARIFQQFIQGEWTQPFDMGHYVTTVRSQAKKECCKWVDDRKQYVGRGTGVVRSRNTDLCRGTAV